MKKRILLVSPSELCVGGVSKVIITLTKELHEEYIFDLATLSAKRGYFDAEFSSYGGTIYRIPSIQYLEHKILHPLSFFQIRKEITKILKRNRYDVIHCHGGYLDGACLLAAAQLGLPVRISHGHGTYVWNGRNLFMRFYFWFAKKYIKKYATVRLACSSIAGDTLFLGDDYENILNPVDLSEYAGIERMPHVGINLLQIGYFCKRKNQVFSVELLHVLRQRNIDAHLSLIGYPSEHDYFEKINKMIKQFGLEQFVSILPPDQDKRSEFAQADYLLLPSTSEGLPLVALESQAAGVPCLMSDTISTDSDVGAGFFLPYNDLEKWADTIIRGVQIDAEILEESLQEVSTQAYVDKIRNIYK